MTSMLRGFLKCNATTVREIRRQTEVVEASSSAAPHPNGMLSWTRQPRQAASDRRRIGDILGASNGDLRVKLP
jgi:hypothetical protein